MPLPDPPTATLSPLVRQLPIIRCGLLSRQNACIARLLSEELRSQLHKRGAGQSLPNVTVAASFVYHITHMHSTTAHTCIHQSTRMLIPIGIVGALPAANTLHIHLAAHIWLLHVPFCRRCFDALVSYATALAAGCRLQACCRDWWQRLVDARQPAGGAAAAFRGAAAACVPTADSKERQPPATEAPAGRRPGRSRGVPVAFAAPLVQVGSARNKPRPARRQCRRLPILGAAVCFLLLGPAGRCVDAAAIRRR